MTISLIFGLVGSSIMISLGGTGSSASTWCQFPSADLTLTGEPSMRLPTRRAISRAWRSRESGLPAPNGSKCVVRSVGGLDSPPVLNGQIHSMAPGESCLSGHANSV